jgi:hypothetical protein
MTRYGVNGTRGTSIYLCIENLEERNAPGDLDIDPPLDPFPPPPPPLGSSSFDFDDEQPTTV